MISRGLTDAIKIIYKRLGGRKIKWALVGSTNMKLQGMKIEPHDLDVVVQLEDLQKLSEIFFDYSTSAIRELKSLSGKPAWEVGMKIGEVVVQFISGDEKDVYVSKLLEDEIIFVKLENIEIPCFTLEAEAQAYIKTNRKDKADLIQKYLSARVGG